MLCWLGFSSDSFLSSADSVNADIAAAVKLGQVLFIWRTLFNMQYEKKGTEKIRTGRKTKIIKSSSSRVMITAAII